MKWISVEDRLPEKNVRVLAWFDASAHHSGVTWQRSGIDFAAWWGDKWNQTMIRDTLKSLDANELTVTHWMPLPEPPKEKT